MATEIKTTELPAIDVVALTDLVAVVDDPGGASPQSKKGTVAQLRDAVHSGAIVSPVGVISSEGNPAMYLLKNTAGGVDEKFWRILGFPNALQVDVVNDTFSQGGTTPIQILRTGLTIPQLIVRVDGATDDAILLSAKTSVLNRFTVLGPVPAVVLTEADGVVNERRWALAADASTWSLRLVNEGDDVWSTALSVTRTSVMPGPVALPDYAKGAGAITGRTLVLGRNTTGNGAASAISLAQRNGAPQVLWVEAGKLRLGPAAPTEDNAVSHTSGVVVGDQTTVLAEIAALREQLAAAEERIAALEAQA